MADKRQSAQVLTARLKKVRREVNGWWESAMKSQRKEWKKDSGWI
jgi:hypothetical protein